MVFPLIYSKDVQVNRCGNKGQKSRGAMRISDNAMGGPAWASGSRELLGIEFGLVSCLPVVKRLGGFSGWSGVGVSCPLRVTQVPWDVVRLVAGLGLHAAAARGA